MRELDGVPDLGDQQRRGSRGLQMEQNADMKVV
jgi:hypothetical protein